MGTLHSGGVLLANVDGKARAALSGERLAFFGDSDKQPVVFVGVPQGSAKIVLLDATGKPLWVSP